MITLLLVLDADEVAFPVNEEIHEAPDTDEKAQALFAALTPCKQRGLIHHINSAISSQEPLTRVSNLTANLKRDDATAISSLLLRKATL